MDQHQDDVWMELRTTDEWNKIQNKLRAVEEAINAITVHLCAPDLDDKVVLRLKRERRELVEERRFLIQARKAEPVLLNMSPSLSQIREQMIEKANAANARRTPQNHS